MKYIVLIIGLLALLVIGCSTEYVTGVIQGREVPIPLSDVQSFYKYKDVNLDGHFEIGLISKDRLGWTAIEGGGGEGEMLSKEELVAVLVLVISQEEKEKIYTYIGEDTAEALKKSKEEDKFGAPAAAKSGGAKKIIFILTGALAIGGISFAGYRYGWPIIQSKTLS